MKRMLSALLAVLMLLSVAACNPTPPADTDTQTSVRTEPVTGQVTEPITEKETEQMTEIVTDEPIVDEDPVFYEKADRDPFDPDSADVSGADWNATIVSANERANGVGGKFADAGRNRFLIYNQNASLLYNLTGEGSKLVEGLYNAEGKAYFKTRWTLSSLIPTVRNTADRILLQTAE